MARYALVIGITDYDNRNFLPRLSKPAIDAEAVAQLLERTGTVAEVERLPKQWISAKKRDKVVPGKVTSSEMYQALENILKGEQTRNQEVFIYFSGHGFCTERSKQAYLATSDSQPTGGDTAISLKGDLSDLIAKSSLSNLVMVLDCCHAGALLDTTSLESSLSAFLGKQDYCVIAACRSGQDAYEDDQYSLFTKALLDGLSPQQADPETGEISIGELFSFIDRELRNKGQEPITLGVGRSLILVKYQKQIKIEEFQPLFDGKELRFPYQGLKAFTKKERPFFFGRKRVVEAIKAKLERQNFVPLIGASGSGKSSVVLAGLIPWLEELGWKVFSINPGKYPLVELEDGLRNLFPEKKDLIHEWIDDSQSDEVKEKGLKLILERFSNQRKFLLVVDQFEELFTVGLPKQRDRFINLITQVAKFPDSPLVVVTTMRADFLEPCLPYDFLRQLIQNNAEYLPTLAGFDLIEAITEPAKRQGYEVTKNLLNKILEDVKQEPGFLPLLEFALTQLWQKRDPEKHQLTLEVYEAIGGVIGALNRRVEKVYNYKDYETDKPVKERTESEKALIRLIFLKLLRTSEAGKDTRQRQNKEEILELAGEDSKNREVLRKLIEELLKARLLVTGETEQEVWVDLAHEALIENWKKLEEWRKESRDIRRIAELLKNAYLQWLENKKKAEYLLEGVLRQLAHENRQELKYFGISNEVWNFCEESFSVYSFATQIYYKDLATYLKVKNWKEADLETARLILKAAKCEAENYLNPEAIKKLLAEDLQKINQLWMKYSEGKFGFSVQKEIYQSLGATGEYNEERWTNFCDRVGWKKDGDWLYHDDLTFNLNAPKGHLPAAVRLYWEHGWWCHDFCHYLFSRPDLWTEKSMISTVELTDSRQDKELLRHFYRELYAHEFPDPDERESLANMEQYLELKAQGWYGKNNYHIIISFQDGKPIAGAIADFLATANTGVLEFLVVAPEFRHQGIGKALLEATESLLLADARQKLGQELDCIVGEMNDPFQTTNAEDNLDPARRTLLWHKWGYGGLDFPYVQPALSDSQEPVGNLLLIAKIFREAWSRAIPSQTVKAIVHEYLRWAMRLETPDDCAEYREMAAFLDGRREVPVLSLARYLGWDPLKSMDIRDVKSPDEADFAAVMSVYQRSFPAGPLTIQPQEFGEALASVEQFKQSFRYHLWAIRTTPTAPVEGMASFFSFPGAGFGGYVTFEGSLSGTWRTRSLLARMERQMLQDREPDGVGGWYIETDLAKKRSPFLRLGFWEVDVEYEQPPLSEQQVSLQIRLFYKPFGRVYGMPKVKCSDFLTAIAQIFRVVYRIETPQQHPSYRKLAAQVDSFVDGWMRFCEK